MATKIKVRFNLGRGEHFMKWKVEHPEGEIHYYTPSEVQLVLSGCQLKNNRNTAMKILKGEHKTVCAWVLCDEIKIQHQNFIEDNHQGVSYNPRVLPYWNRDGMDMDGSRIKEMYTIGSKLNIK